MYIFALIILLLLLLIFAFTPNTGKKQTPDLTLIKTISDGRQLVQFANVEFERYQQYLRLTTTLQRQSTPFVWEPKEIFLRASVEDITSSKIQLSLYVDPGIVIMFTISYDNAIFNSKVIRLSKGYDVTFKGTILNVERKYYPDDGDGSLKILPIMVSLIELYN